MNWKWWKYFVVVFVGTILFIGFSSVALVALVTVVWLVIGLVVEYIGEDNIILILALGVPIAILATISYGLANELSTKE